jgi:hypothetical protein
MADDVDSVINSDIEHFKRNEGFVEYPFPVEEFALKVFGLDVQYGDFDELFESEQIRTNQIYGCLFPDKHYFFGQDKLILVNENREHFVIGELVVPDEFYKEGSERQTIAHEIGHYADLHHNPSLFVHTQVNDAPTILLHDPANESFANKYARRLLMPETEVKRVKSDNEILGSIDMLSHAALFKRHFGVTQFMVEVRLKELNISFINGVYINKHRRSRGKPYSEGDLMALANLSFPYDMAPNYADCERIAVEYNKLREQDRDGGSLYMAIWRINTGHYDRFEKLLELRMRLNDRVLAERKQPMAQAT